MKIFQLVYHQLETKTIQAPSLKDAHQQAQSFAKLNPSVKLLSLTEYNITPVDVPTESTPH